MGGQLPSCPFLHSESFHPLGLLRMVVILVCCQSVVPSTSLLNVDLGRTHRNQVACMMLEHYFAESKSLDSWLLNYQFRMYGWLDGLTQRKCFLKNTLLNKAGFWIQSVLSILVEKGSNEESSASYVKNGKHDWMTFLFESYEINFRQTKDVSTDGSGNVCHIEFYAVSYVWVHALRWHRLPAQKDPTSCNRANVQDANWTESILNSSLYTPIWLH